MTMTQTFSHTTYNAATGETETIPYSAEEYQALQESLAVPEEQSLSWLRAERNRLLAETDYLALADTTLTDEMRAYRQALRDLPSNTADPANPVWPEKPAN